MLSPEDTYSVVRHYTDQQLLATLDEEEVFIDTSSEPKSKEFYNVLLKEAVRRNLITLED